ncbi:MAG: sensor histidine kinase [Verrucomicrobia bacterium]|jgi:signal transduction histidine kinase|nr:sensor histidine kinase [Verrucomicrobiota bacterium]
MSPLARFVATALFVVLVALVAVLAVPVWREARLGSGPATRTAPSDPARVDAHSGKAGANARALSLRVALALAGTCLVLAVPLLLNAALRPARVGDSHRPFEGAKSELSTLARLAESSVAQGEELSRERDVRRRAEEDARLKQQLLTQSLDEKIRLGRDLHDGIIQSLYAAGLTLESVRALLKENPDEAERRLEQTRASLNSAIRDVRAYIAGLTPDSLRRTGFARALSHLMSELRAGREAQIDLQIDDETAALLTPEQSLEVLQIAREAVSNALRHGQATKIAIRMHQGDREVCLLVQDDGSGFDPARNREGGHGLANMRARAELIGASLRIISQPAQGTRVLTTVPVTLSNAS